MHSNPRADKQRRQEISAKHLELNLAVWCQGSLHKQKYYEQ